MVLPGGLALFNRRTVLTSSLGLALWPNIGGATKFAEPCSIPPSELMPWEPPFIVGYANSQAKIRFLASRHEFDPTSATHNLIQRELGRGLPFLIVEGVPSSLGKDPPHVINDAKNMLRAGRIPEPLYAVALAADRGLSVMGGDLSTSELITHSRASGFNSADILGSHVLRRMTNDKGTSPAALVERMRRYFPDIEKSFSFEDWFKETYDVPYSISENARNLGTPCGADLASRIVRSETDARNNHLHQIIATFDDKLLDKMVVFGANHLLALHPALSKTFPNISSPRSATFI